MEIENEIICGDNMKFKIEQEFCEHVTKLILGILVGENRRVVCVPEVPRYYYSNEHVDMMLLDVKNKEILCIEYKLNDPKKLTRQAQSNRNQGLNCIGIINSENRSLSDRYDGGIEHIFGYTGKDSQLERIAKYITYSYATHWGSIYTRRGMMYYWAYKNNQNSFDGGTFGIKRQMFASVYIQAIQNLHAEYGKLDFMLTHAALRSGYSVATSRKYYNRATATGALFDQP